MKQKGFSSIILLVVVLLVIGAGYAYFKSREYHVCCAFPQEPSQSKLKTFLDPKTGMSLRYPNYILLNDKSSKINDQINMSIISEKINEIGFQTHGYDQETAMKDEKELIKGNFGYEITQPVRESKRVIKIGDTYAKTFTHLGQGLALCSSYYERGVLFYKNDYRIILRLNIPEDILIKTMPEYFIKDEENCGGDLVFKYGEETNTATASNLYETLENKKGTLEVQSWFDSFDEIVQTITFVDIPANPKLTARAFYTEYIEAGHLRGGPVPNLKKYINISGYLGAELRSKMLENTNLALCWAQELPDQGIDSIELVSNSEDKATVVVHVMYSGSGDRSVQVDLNKISNAWKITNITCDGR